MPDPPDTAGTPATPAAPPTPTTAGAATNPPSGPAETTIWSGCPSHVSKLGTYTLCVLLCWLVVPIFIALWTWLQVRCIRYEITTQRLRFTTGLFSKRLEEVELYRVKDTTLEEPWLYRMFGAGNIVIATHDASTPRLVLEAVPGARDKRERLRLAIEAVRERKGVRMLETE